MLAKDLLPLASLALVFVYRYYKLFSFVQEPPEFTNTNCCKS